MISRRNFCAGGLASLIAAPYVIRKPSVLMPVRDRQSKWIATYSVRGYDQWGSPKSELLHFRGPILPFAPDITGFHSLARMAGLEWENITSIECISLPRLI